MCQLRWRCLTLYVYVCYTFLTTVSPKWPFLLYIGCASCSALLSLFSPFGEVGDTHNIHTHVSHLKKMVYFLFLSLYFQENS